MFIYAGAAQGKPLSGTVCTAQHGLDAAPQGVIKECFRSISMPMFDFVCTACGNKFEDLVFGDESPACPKCGAATEKQMCVPSPLKTGGLPVQARPGTAHGKRHAHLSCGELLFRQLRHQRRWRPVLRHVGPANNRQRPGNPVDYLKNIQPLARQAKGFLAFVKALLYTHPNTLYMGRNLCSAA